MNAPNANSTDGFDGSDRDEMLVPAESRSFPLLTQYMMMALRRKWTILGSIATCLIAALLFTLLATPKYTAVTQIEVDRGGRVF